MATSLRALFIALVAVFLHACGAKQCEESPAEEIVCFEDAYEIDLKITDRRWCKEGGYGMPKVTVYLKHDLAKIIQPSVEGCFADVNLSISENGIPVEIEIEQFFTDVTQHRESWNCVSEIIFNVRVLDQTGKELYDRRMSGIAENDFSLSVRSGKSRKVLDTALEDALDALLHDKGFRNALKKADSCLKDD